MKNKIVQGSLYIQVLLGLLVGVVLGYFYPEVGGAMKPLGEVFIRMIKMVVAPIIFCTIVLGIAGMRDVKSIKRAGGLALLYFEVMSTFALILGVACANVFEPGVGMNIDPAFLDQQSTAGVHAASRSAHGAVEFMVGIVPVSIVDAFARGDILQVLFVAVLFGFVLQNIGGRDSMVFTFIEKIARIMFGIVGLVMKFAPIAVFGAVAFAIGQYGIATLIPLGKLVVLYYLTCIFFVMAVLGLVAKLHGFSIWKFLLYIKEELTIVFGIAASEAVLPRVMYKMERLGLKREVVGLVLPTGYSFNLDGAAIYLGMAALFIAQATGAPMSFAQELKLILVLILTSKGVAGVPGGSTVVLAGTLTVIGDIPVAGVALVLGIDRFMDAMRSVVNVVGNGVAAIVVARWAGALNKEQLRYVLNEGKDVRDLAS